MPPQSRHSTAVRKRSSGVSAHPLRTIAVALAIAAALLSPALAWGTEGHRIATGIAELN